MRHWYTYVYGTLTILRVKMCVNRLRFQVVRFQILWLYMLSLPVRSWDTGECMEFLSVFIFNIIYTFTNLKQLGYSFFFKWWNEVFCAFIKEIENLPQGCQGEVYFSSVIKCL